MIYSYKKGEFINYRCGIGVLGLFEKELNEINLPLCCC